MNVREFFKRFPDDDTCLEHVMRVRYGLEHECQKCGKLAKFHRLTKRPAYSCSKCSAHVYPCANTPMYRTRTPLQMWFYAIYLFTTTRHGVSAKELERQLGVTYKTAWRMGHEIRKHMDKLSVTGNPGSGHYELDETHVGGKPRGPKDRSGGRARQRRNPNQTIVFGVVEREADIQTLVVSGAKKDVLFPLIRETVKPGARISTDQLRVYSHLGDEGYEHTVVNHSIEYVNGDTYTNTLEGFWSHFKCSVRGTHRAISPKHMSKYLGEFEFRFNHRNDPKGRMLDRLIQAF